MYRNTVILLLTLKAALPNDWSTRSTSRSLPTPTALGNYSSRRFRPREFPEPGIRNISFMLCQDNGSGPSVRQTIGATTLDCPCTTEPTLSKTISYRILSRRFLRRHSRPLIPWPHSCMNVCWHPWHPGNLANIGEWYHA
jgi:hypothetical protein